MKIQDLMINDWVEWMGNYCKVDLPLLMTEYQDNVDSKFVKPIPLTPEILEKNGFYVYNKDDYSDTKLDINIDDDNLYQISINRKGNNYHIAIHYIKWFDHKTGKYDSHCLYSNGLFSEFKPLYIHELQHALRLCKLDKIANDFKI